MDTVCMHDRAAMEAFFRRDSANNVYQLGDLDDPFWSYTTWYALSNGGDIRAVAMIYAKLRPPCLLATGGADDLPHLNRLVESILHLLPPRFFSHLAVGLGESLAPTHHLEPHGLHCKMSLNAAALPACDGAGVVRLGPPDRDELLDFCRRGNLGQWFDPDTLATNRYFGLRQNDQLVSMAATHTESRTHAVAALGNIGTLPEFRSRGCARAVTAALCRDLLADGITQIGLNVKADNAPAIRCYQSLGFTACGQYEEYMVQKREV